MERRRRLKATALVDRMNFVVLRAGGLSLRAIARETGSSVRTVSRWLQRWQREGSLHRQCKRILKKKGKITSPFPYRVTDFQAISMDNTQTEPSIVEYTSTACCAVYPQTINGRFPRSEFPPHARHGLLSYCPPDTERYLSYEAGSHCHPYLYSERLQLIAQIQNNQFGYI